MISLPYDKYDRYFIAHLDILGFKKMIENKSCSFIFDIFDKHMKSNSLLSILSKDGNSLFDLSQIHIKVMSDSIVYYVSGKLPNAFSALVVSCMSFQSELLLHDPPILTRGGVAYGKLFAGELPDDKDILFGPAFVEAYKLEEYVAKTPRIILSGITLWQGKRNTENRRMCNIVDEMIFCDNDEFYVLDSCKFMLEHDNNGEQCAKLLSYIQKMLDTEYDVSVREKYIYLKKRLQSYTKETTNV